MMSSNLLKVTTVKQWRPQPVAVHETDDLGDRHQLYFQRWLRQ